MPIYEYRCQKCNTVHEELVPMSERNLPRVCQKDGCGGESQHIVSASHFQLEGVTGAFPGAALKWDKRHGKTT